MATLLELQGKGIVALPIHDCVVVAERDQATAREVMLSAFLRLEGQEAIVEIEGLLDEAA